MCVSSADTHFQVASWDGPWTVFGHRGRRVSARERSRLSCVGQRLAIEFRPFQHPTAPQLPATYLMPYLSRRPLGEGHSGFFLPRSASSMPPHPKLPSLIGWTGHTILLPLFLLQKLPLGKTGWRLFCTVEQMSLFSDESQRLIFSLRTDSCMFSM